MMSSQDTLTSRLSRPIKEQNGRKAKSLQYNQRNGDGLLVQAPPQRAFTVDGSRAYTNSNSAGLQRGHEGKRSFFIVRENAPTKHTPTPQSKSFFIADH